MNESPSPSPALPNTGFLRQPQVLAFVPISKSTLWRRIGAGQFPAPVKLSERISAWRVEDVRHWIVQHGQTEQVSPVRPSPAPKR